MANITADTARNMRYRKPMLSMLGFNEIENELNDIEEACGCVHWFVDNDDDTLVASLDGNEDEAYEFKMAFSEVESKACELREVLNEIQSMDDDFETLFNDCTVALLGNRYSVLGYDTYQEDYFAMCRYEQNLAEEEAGKRLMRKTKAEIISTIGQCIGIVLSFADLRQQYDSLKAQMDILRNENVSLLDTIKKIDEKYKEACEEKYYDSEFDNLLKRLPDRCWLE